jgi:K+-transporting ATPase A subunit
MKTERSNTTKIVFRVVLTLALLWFIYIFKVLSDESHTLYTSYKAHYDSLAVHPAFQQLPETLKHGSANQTVTLAKHHILSFEAYAIAVLVSGVVMAVLLFQLIILLRTKKPGQST